LEEKAKPPEGVFGAAFEKHNWNVSRNQSDWSECDPLLCLDGNYVE